MVDRHSMRVGMVGINQKSAPVGVRETFAQASLRALSRPAPWRQYAFVLLSTCNRTEIYFSSHDLAETHGALLALLRQEIAEAFEHRLYSYFGKECFIHLASVTTGLDSALLGETEIQGQVKRAYEEAAALAPLPHELHFLFQKCLKIGKEVRFRHGFTQRISTLEETVVTLGTRTLGTLHNKKWLFVGLSQINSHIALYCKQRGEGPITFCNRSEEKLAQWVPRLEMARLPWDDLPRWPTFDLIVCATRAPEFLLVRPPPPGKKRVVMDLSVPRNVHPAVASDPDTALFNLDHIYALMRGHELLLPSEVRRIHTEIITDRVERQIALWEGYHERSLSRSHDASVRCPELPQSVEA